MNREQIIEMAREAGFGNLVGMPHIAAMERFAILVRAETKEEDAKIVEAEHLDDPQSGEDDAYDAAVAHCASAIRLSK